jgi:hypothetical protein
VQGQAGGLRARANTSGEGGGNGNLTQELRLHEKTLQGFSDLKVSGFWSGKALDFRAIKLRNRFGTN